ncbi:MAG: transcriptional regulator, TetR family [uncultured Sphingomonadaceae bacterium]|uniref:Transcriptional regulator, TetR family n=1 Tax=uncultured Sphingomonadaceae bacterium TaxID=169976 RepID=A0A6J4TYB1_9SPHN|nr:MAG: transcriptional regulator, TetR family [uncultured Sphingomonadaceae bacterium]
MVMTGICEATTRPKNAAATREAILAAARARFLEESYDNVGLRDIAGDAGVDVALVSRYFGGKEKLFAEVLKKPDEHWLPDGISGDELPALLTTLFMNHNEDEHRQHAEHLLIMLRSASSPNASPIVREALRSEVMEPLAACLKGPNAEARASLAIAVWMGATMLRAVMPVEPMCDNKCEFLEAKLILSYEAALSEIDLGSVPACGSGPVTEAA